MSIKYKVAKLEEIPENVRSLYVQQPDGSYILDAEGVVPKEKLDEFRSNNIQLQQQMDKLKDIDPEKYKELIKLDQEVKTGELIKAGKLEEAVNLRVDSMKTDLESKIRERDDKLSAANSQLSALLFDGAVKSAAIKSGVLPTAMDDLVYRARGSFVVENGSPVPKKDGKTVFGKDGTTPMSIEEWTLNLKPMAPHLFQGSQGSGAGGGQGNGGKNMKDMTPAQKIQAGLEAGGLLSNMPSAVVRG